MLHPRLSCEVNRTWHKVLQNCLVTAVLSRAQAPTRRMLVDQKALGEPPVFSGRKEDFHVWAKKIENYVSGCVPDRAWSFDVCGGVAGRGHSDISCTRCA